MSISELVNFTMVWIDWFPMMFEFGWSLHVIGQMSLTSVLFLQKYFYLIFLFDDSVISHKKIIYDL